MVVHEYAFVAYSLLTDVAQEDAVLLKLSQFSGAGTEDAHPQTGKHVAVHFLLSRGLARDGAGEVEKVLIDGVEVAV